MDARSENSEFDDDDEPDILEDGDDDFDVQHVLEDLEREAGKKTVASSKAARQRIEEYLEEKRHRREMHDIFDDFDDSDLDD